MADLPVKAPPHPSAASGFGDKNDHIIERRSLRDYYIILRERLWIALPTAVIVAAGYAYLQARKPQMYRTTASMEFTPPQRVVTQQGVTETSIQTDADLNTQIAVLQQNSLRTRVFNSFSPDEIKILQQPFLRDLPPGAAPPNDEGLLGSMSATPRRLTYFVDITVSHRGSEAAALVANRYVDQYILTRTEDLSGTNSAALELLDQQIGQARLEIDKARKEQTDFATKNRLTDLGGTNSIAEARLQTAVTERDNTRLRVDDLQRKQAQLDTYLAEKRDLMELSWIANYGSVAALHATLAETTKKLNAALEIFLSKAPPLVQLVAAEENDRAILAQEQGRAIQNLRNDLATARNALAAREAEYEARLAESLDYRKVSDTYKSLESQVKSAQDAYADLLANRSRISVVSNTQKVSLRPRDKAGPGYLYEPNMRSIIRTAIGLGLIAFFGVAVGLSFIDDRIKSAWDVEHFVGVNLLGIVPDLSALKDDEKYTLVFNNRQVPGTEAFLSVYSAVKIHSKLDFPKAILITSTIPGEGKTLISCNLAGSFARHGKRTLLIDCDLRRPMVHRYFKQENSRGIITWFEAGAKVEGPLAQDPALGIIKLGENFSLMCSGGRSKSPTDILESPAFGQLIAQLKKEYDLVVIDSPPLGAVTDSLLIAEATDEVIYVCRFNRAYRKHIRLYVKALRNGKNEILGVVLNGLSPRRIEYYSNYRYYRSYKKYYGAQT